VAREQVFFTVRELVRSIGEILGSFYGPASFSYAPVVRARREMHQDRASMTAIMAA
jgi:hypothetical protein